MKLSPRHLTLAALGSKVLDQLLTAAAARDGVRDNRPPLEFRQVLNNVTAVPESCRLKNGNLDVPAFFEWFCPTLDPEEAWRLAKLPGVALIQLEEQAVRAFIELHAYRSDLS